MTLNQELLGRLVVMWTGLSGTQPSRQSAEDGCSAQEAVLWGQGLEKRNSCIKTLLWMFGDFAG